MSWNDETIRTLARRMALEVHQSRDPQFGRLVQKFCRILRNQARMTGSYQP